MNFAKFLRTAFLTEHLRWLRLKYEIFLYFYFQTRQEETETERPESYIQILGLLYFFTET